MVSEVELFPLIFAFSILLVFLNRFYRRYVGPCLARGSRQQTVRGVGLIIFSVCGSVLLRVLGY
jgi:hypothetical protein